jgi:hypothetical protein
MPITLPNLDDRSYADLVEEARELLVAHAPALTDHNPSDPAITLLELFAYFTEALLFRVNTVTDANRVKFLRLLNGPEWPTPASREELEAQLRDAVLTLRRTDRAITAADFEFLARAADPGRIARAHCIPLRDLESAEPSQRLEPRPGHVSVVIVPYSNPDLAALRAIVAAYLEPRRLLTERVHVVGARLVPIGVRLTIRLMPDALVGQMTERVAAALKDYFDPIKGYDGNGWPLGRNVYVSEIYRLLDTLPGVDFVRRTFEANTARPFDEVATREGFASRRVRNEAGELVGVALDPDELVDFQIALSDIGIEEPPPTFVSSNPRTISR